MSSQSTTRHCFFFTLSSTSCCSCRIASGANADMCGPTAIAASISLRVHGRPVVVGHPSFAKLCSSSAAGCSNAKPLGHIDPLYSRIGCFGVGMLKWPLWFLQYETSACSACFCWRRLLFSSRCFSLFAPVTGPPSFITGGANRRGRSCGASAPSSSLSSSLQLSVSHCSSMYSSSLSSSLLSSSLRCLRFGRSLGQDQAVAVLPPVSPVTSVGCAKRLPTRRGVSCSSSSSPLSSSLLSSSSVPCRCRRLGKSRGHCFVRLLFTGVSSDSFAVPLCCALRAPAVLVGVCGDSPSCVLPPKLGSTSPGR